MTPPAHKTALHTGSLIGLALLVSCGTPLPLDEDTTGGARDSGAADRDADGGAMDRPVEETGPWAVTYTLSDALPTTSCSSEGNRAVTFASLGCPTVTLAGAFFDETDGSSGQITGLAVSDSGMSLTWDEHPLRGDCDLDIASEVSWSARRSDQTMTIVVTDRILETDSENQLAAGYTITDYGTTLRESGSGTRSFTYVCDG